MDLSNIDNKANFVLDFVPNGIYNETKGIYKLQMFFTASISEKNIVVVSLECNAIFQFRKNTKIENIPPYFYPNSIAVIFPYIRAMVSTLSLQANVNPIVLPTMNLSSLQETLKKSTSLEK